MRLIVGKRDGAVLRIDTASRVVRDIARGEDVRAVCITGGGDRRPFAVATLALHSQQIKEIDLSEDDRVLVTGSVDRTIRILNAPR